MRGCCPEDHRSGGIILSFPTPLRALVWFYLVLILLLPLPSSAQDAEAFLADLRALAAQQENRIAVPRVSQPSTLGIPSGFGLGHGNIGFGAAFTNRRDREIRDWDGSAAISFGFGNAREAVGAEVILGLVSLTPPWRRVGDSSVLGEDGNLSFKLFREFHNARTGHVSALSIGASNALRWGDPKTVPVNYYIAGSTTFSVPWRNESTRPGMLTLGMGSAVRNIERDFGVFGGVAMGLTPWMSVGVSWLGDEAIIGTQFTPQIGQRLNLQLGLYYADATRRVSPSGRFILNVSVLAQGLY